MPRRWDHRHGILAYYDCPITTAALEGTNNKIKTMQRQAYGFRDHEFFKLKIYALHETDLRISRMSLFYEMVAFGGALNPIVNRGGVFWPESESSPGGTPGPRGACGHCALAPHRPRRTVRKPLRILA